MAATKSKNTQKMEKKSLLIGGVIFVLILIPFILWLVHYSKDAGLLPYQGDSYTFSYPEKWTVKNNDRSDIGGTELFLQPPDAAPPETPYVIIDEAPATQNAESKLIQPFTIFKYTKTDTTINGITAQKYTTVVHAAEGVFHSTAYVFESKGNIYLITVGYKQESPDTELENEFSKIVNTFNPR